MIKSCRVWRRSATGVVQFKMLMCSFIIWKIGGRCFIWWCVGGVVRRMSKRWEPIRLRGVGGMPQYEAGSDGKCFNIRQGVRRRIRFGRILLLPSSSNCVWNLLTILEERDLEKISLDIFPGRPVGLSCGVYCNACLVMVSSVLLSLRPSQLYLLLFRSLALDISPFNFESRSLLRVFNILANWGSCGSVSYTLEHAAYAMCWYRELDLFNSATF